MLIFLVNYQKTYFKKTLFILIVVKLCNVCYMELPLCVLYMDILFITVSLSIYSKF